jgi:threonine/homoserine/homoserine lactone efflux protein
VTDPSTLALFMLASLALAVVPGPAVLYIVAQSVDQGRFAGLVSALGIGTGGLVHVVAATIGLSSLLASSATAFTIVKYAGAAYLVLLGIRRLLTREPVATRSPARRERGGGSFETESLSTSSTRRRRSSSSLSCRSSSIPTRRRRRFRSSDWG